MKVLKLIIIFDCNLLKKVIPTNINGMIKNSKGEISKGSVW